MDTKTDRKPLKRAVNNGNRSYKYRGYLITRNYPDKPSWYWKCIAGIYQTKTGCMLAIDDYIESHQSEAVAHLDNIEQVVGFVRALDIFAPLLNNNPERFDVLFRAGITPSILKQVVNRFTLSQDAERIIRDYSELFRQD